MKSKIFFLTFLICSALSAQKGTISGTLTDKDMNNAPLQFANAALKGTGIGVTTDEKGNYSIKTEAGKYTLVLSFVGYESIELPVTVKAGETITINRALGSGSIKLDDVVIQKSVNREKETVLLLEQKKAVEIKQSIGAQELSRKGVSDVEEGLTKITGISKVGSRGLFVRGLEDRYNSLLINNLAVPSNNPFKKIIPLDLIPTDVVSLIETYKTFNPDIYGDFAGATFNVVTTTKPLKSSTKISLGTGFTTNNNLRNFNLPTTVSSTKGFFGYAGGDRELPAVFNSTPNPPVTVSRNDAINTFKNGFGMEQSRSPLNTNFGILHAEKFDVGKNKLSYLFSINFDNSYQFRQGVDRTLQAGSLIQYSNNFRKTTYAYKTNVSSILGINFNSDRFSIATSLLYLKTTDSQIQDQLGIQSAFANNPNFLIRTNQFEASDFYNAQVFGDYKLTKNKNHLLRYGASLAQTQFSQPDRNSYTGTAINDQEVIVSYGGNNFLRQFLDLKSDLFSSAFLEYQWKFGTDNKLTVGYNGNHNFTKSSYRFINTVKNFNTASSFTINPYEIDATIRQDLLDYEISFQEQSNANWRSKLEETINGGYAAAYFKINEALSINTGLRLEKYNRITKYKEIGAFDQKYIKIKADDLYVLPSVNVKYNLNEKTNLRLAASQTYTKPVIMESFPISIVNPDGTVFQGNPYLKNSTNTNLDFKYEIFPTGKELLAIGVFGKNIQNPIERTFIANPGTTIMSFLNSERALLYGVEAEFILDLSRFSNQLKDFSWGLNTSIMNTQVSVPNTNITPTGNSGPSIETHRERELQGASKWIINSDVKYDFKFSSDWTNTLTIVYSVFGKRIYSIGTAGIDHVYELPVSKLDVVWASKVNKHIDFKLSADNVLNPYYRLELGNNNKDTFIESSRRIQDYKRGVGFSLNLSYTF